MQSSGVVNIRGKDYQTVALRVQLFREKHPDWRVLTEIHTITDQVVVVRACIANSDGDTLATGHAEESRTASQINKTSALENCETSAIGRALAALGYGGSEFASANEVANAIGQQHAPKQQEVKQESKPTAQRAGKLASDTERQSVAAMADDPALTASQREWVVKQSEKFDLTSDEVAKIEQWVAKKVGDNAKL